MNYDDFPAPVTPEQEELAARAVLTASVWAFLDGAAGSEETPKHANRRAWESVFVEHRLPADVSKRTTEATVLGIESSAPIAVAPMGLADEIWPHGELEIATACADVGIPMVVSTMSSTRIEDIVKTGARCAFQLYWVPTIRERRELIERAEQSGCEALVVTIDTPLRRGSEREQTTGFAPEAAPAMTSGTTILPTLTWDDLEQLTGSTSLPLYIKGVLSPEGARRALEIGAAGVVVSNHGGRQLSCAVPTAMAVPRVVDAVANADPQDRFDIAVDGGIRTGTDVLRALALGAGAVLVGRQVLYGLARNGAQGAFSVLRRISAEFKQDLTLTGCSSPADAQELRWFSLR